MTRGKKRKRIRRAHPGPSGNGTPTEDSLPKTIAVDFDGVIANYDGWKGFGILGLPRRDVRTALKKLHAEGWKIVIHTTRGEEEISAYLVEHGIPHHEINRNSDYTTRGGKPVADVYWDDRALCYSGNARRDLVKIRRFRTWSGR
jgi:hydroxymethylpyrimidine pyrophosphatase-like HAD family hydrolase